MSEYLAAAAKALNMPEAIVKRSAEARAKSTGASVDSILEAWATGADSPSGGSAAAPTPPAPTPPAPSEAPADAGPAPVPVPAAATPPTEPPGAVVPLPIPETVSPEEALAFPVVVSVPTAGLTERTDTSIPRWLSALFVLIPLFGVLYLAGGIGDAGACQEGGVQLAVNRVSGLAENCDGTEFTGRGAAGGGAGAEFIAQGEEIFATCAGCHGPQGQGSGAFPALTGVLSTFGACADHVGWVRLGSAGFQAAGSTTYGDTAKTINGGMPGFSALTDEQLASVAAFERIRFGGGDQATVLADCGLVEAPTDGTAPAGGETSPATTAAA